MKRVLIVAVCMFFPLPAFAARLNPEKYYQTKWCFANRGIVEYKLFDNTRIDCMTAMHAVEFDFANKWSEAIGQALYYADCTGKIPAIVLIVEKQSDMRYVNRVRNLCKKYGIELFTVN